MYFKNCFVRFILLPWYSFELYFEQRARIFCYHVLIAVCEHRAQPFMDAEKNLYFADEKVDGKRLETCLRACR